MQPMHDCVNINEGKSWSNLKLSRNELKNAATLKIRLHSLKILSSLFAHGISNSIYCLAKFLILITVHSLNNKPLVQITALFL